MPEEEKIDPPDLESEQEKDTDPSDQDLKKKTYSLMKILKLFQSIMMVIFQDLEPIWIQEKRTSKELTSMTRLV